MKINKKSVAVVAALAGLAFAGGAAFTTSNVYSNVQGNGYDTAGYGALSVSGATLVSLNYTLDNNDPPSVTAVTFVVQGDTAAASGYIGFTYVNGYAPSAAGVMGAACQGTFNNTNTVYSGCLLPGGNAVPVSDIATTDIAVAPTT